MERKRIIRAELPICLVAGIGLLLAAMAASAQPPAALATVEGIVLDADSRQPVVGASVRLTADDDRQEAKPRPVRVRTGQDGRFEARVPVGPYQLKVSARDTRRSPSPAQASGMPSPSWRNSLRPSTQGMPSVRSRHSPSRCGSPKLRPPP